MYMEQVPSAATPKMGDPDDYPNGNGPQGDVVRIYNYVRLVRDADIISGYNEIELNEDSFKIYPNPAVGYIKVDLSQDLTGEITIQIINFMGEIISERDGQSIGSVYINLLDYNPGIYFLRIINNESIYSKKFIKE